MLDKIRYWFGNVARFFTVQDSRDSTLSTQQLHDSINTESHDTPSVKTKDLASLSSIRQFPDPYIGLPLLGMGMTGFIYELGEDRVVKKTRQSQLPDPGDAEYMNKYYQRTLENESKVFKRLGTCEGIIPHFRVSQLGIELARAQCDLEDYLNTYPDPGSAVKVTWILSLIETFSYIHSRRVFVDDIAPRNILILNNQLKVADFGQSILLPLDADITSAIEGEDLNARVEILHLGWILYSIVSWRVHKYYFFDDNPDLCWPTSFPDVEDILCGKLIEKCWRGEYISMDQLQHEALETLGN